KNGFPAGNESVNQGALADAGTAQETDLQLTFRGLADLLEALQVGVQLRRLVHLQPGEQRPCLFAVPGDDLADGAVLGWCFGADWGWGGEWGRRRWSRGQGGRRHEDVPTRGGAADLSTPRTIGHLQLPVTGWADDAAGHDRTAL